MKVAILGFGTVGSGVYDVLTNNADVITAKTGAELEIKYVLDLREFPGDPVEKVLVHDFNVIVNDPEVDIVVEVMGGLHPAYDFSKAAIEAGKSVCTSNKELVAKHGAELIKLAKEKDVNYFFEASVGGGIPIIRQMLRSITCDNVLEINGILNGTTNYMMTRMRNEGLAFDDVLKDAQANGYAERNPAADIEGHDACRKIAILTSLAYGQQVDFEDIHTEGITKISDTDVLYATKLKRAIKLLGTSKLVDGKVYAMVAPKLLKKSNPLYSVEDVFNAIMITGDMLGEVMTYGKGAGKLATASAVVSDVVEVARNNGKNQPIVWREEKLELGDLAELKNSFFLRIPATEAALVKNVLPVAEVVEGVVEGEVGVLTEEITEGALANACEGLTVLSMIRAE